MFGPEALPQDRFQPGNCIATDAGERREGQFPIAGFKPVWRKHPAFWTRVGTEGLDGFSVGDIHQIAFP